MVGAAGAGPPRQTDHPLDFLRKVPDHLSALLHGEDADAIGQRLLEVLVRLRVVIIRHPPGAGGVAAMGERAEQIACEGVLFALPRAELHPRTPVLLVVRDAGHLPHLQLVAEGMDPIGLVLGSVLQLLALVMAQRIVGHGFPTPQRAIRFVERNIRCLRPLLEKRLVLNIELALPCLGIGIHRVVNLGEDVHEQHGPEMPREGLLPVSGRSRPNRQVHPAHL
mmetsp:Transcript_43309/g.130885  ORF Transcript_43309/g.130885 Transcript_43309/m.130885 type:complete len:223 (+) Transcript_43309:616-1284(+)